MESVLPGVRVANAIREATGPSEDVVATRPADATFKVGALPDDSRRAYHPCGWMRVVRPPGSCIVAEAGDVNVIV